jgi:K+-transporting ATPase ATPase B chain
MTQQIRPHSTSPTKAPAAGVAAARPSRQRSLFDPEIVLPAIKASFVKLNPITMLKNPVMFVTEVGAAVTTVELFFARAHGESVGFVLQIALWLWFTVLFANFAEAMAEGRGKAQADALRKTRTRTIANKLLEDGFQQTGLQSPAKLQEHRLVPMVRLGKVLLEKPALNRR